MENFIYFNDKIKGYSGKKLQRSYLNPGVVTYFEGALPITHDHVKSSDKLKIYLRCHNATKLGKVLFLL